MKDAGRDQDVGKGASPSTRRWAARREEVRAAAAADRERASRQRARWQRRMELEASNPVPLYLGLVAVLLLVVVGWCVLDAMRCDWFYANITLAKRHTCE